MSSSLKHKPVFVLSGMSGTGKSLILGDARLMGLKILRSFNKHLLDVRFGYGQPAYKFLIMDQYMQAFHIFDFEKENLGRDIWVIERSILDGYYFILKKFYYEQTIQDYSDMNNVIKGYYDFITNFGNRQLVIVDIWNKDESWITQNLREESTRGNLWSEYSAYLRDQEEYKEWYFKKLAELNIEYKKLPLIINDLKSDFTPDMRRLWIYYNIINYRYDDLVL